MANLNQYPHLPTVPQLVKVGNELASFPYENIKTSISPVQALLVEIVNLNDGTKQCISLKHCYLKYHPKYHKYLKSQEKDKKPGQAAIWNLIHEYYDTMVETPIFYVCGSYLNCSYININICIHIYIWCIQINILYSW